MRNMMTVITTVVGVVAGLALGGLVFAAEEGSATHGQSARAVTVTGENYCVGCALKKEGAAAKCSVYGHRHALKVSEAKDASGNAVPEMEGWTLHYLNNKTGKELVKKHHGETMTLSGRVFPQERVFDVSKMPMAATEGSAAAATTTAATKGPHKHEGSGKGEGSHKRGASGGEGS